MASLQILKSSLTPFSISRSIDFPGKSGSRKKILRFRGYRSSKCVVNTRSRVCCAVQDDDKKSNGEEPPESLFMKELRRRGMNPTSLLENTDRSKYGFDEEINLKEEGGDSSKRNAVSTEYEKNLTKQREFSMALNSEGLEGLIPRAKLLLTIGGTFFFGFWPLILVTVAIFSALYLYFGPAFIHDASRTPASPPPYVDPYALLEDERISQIAPRVN